MSACTSTNLAKMPARDSLKVKREGTSEAREGAKETDIGGNAQWPSTESQRHDGTRCRPVGDRRWHKRREHIEGDALGAHEHRAGSWPDGKCEQRDNG